MKSVPGRRLVLLDVDAGRWFRNREGRKRIEETRGVLFSDKTPALFGAWSKIQDYTMESLILAQDER